MGEFFGCIIWRKIQQKFSEILFTILNVKICDYTWSRKSDFNKHLKSKKHNTTNATKIQQNILHYCECGKKYTHRASLFSKIVSSGLVLVASTTSQVTSYYPLYYISESFL